MGIALFVSAGVIALGRPLLLASIDADVAGAGVPVRLVGYALICLVGVTAGEATQAVGSLLLIGLLAAPGDGTAPHTPCPPPPPPPPTLRTPPNREVRAFTIVSMAAPGIPVPFVAAVVDCDGTSVRGNIINTEPDPEHVQLGMKVKLATYRSAPTTTAPKRSASASSPSKDDRQHGEVTTSGSSAST